MAKRKADFGYQGEKLHKARLCLMAPHPQGEARSFASAFHECSLAFHDFDENSVKDVSAQHWIATIKRLMNTDGIEDPTGEGTYIYRARVMSEKEQLDFSHAVDELASWFDMQFWSEN